MSLATIADTNDGIGKAMRAVAAELESEWALGSRSRVVDLGDVVDILCRVADAIDGGDKCKSR